MKMAASRLNPALPGATPAPNAEQRVAFSAQLPGPVSGAPLLQLSVELVEKNEADGARVRLRAHVHSRFGNARATDSPATDGAAPPASTARSPARRIGQRLANALLQPRIKALAAPLLDHELNSWFEIQISTEPLDGGAAALLPAPERLARLGVVPRNDSDAPIVQSWVSEIGGGKAGFAQLSLLRLAREQLPPRLAALLGSRPLQIAAALVNTVEPDPKHR